MPLRLSLFAALPLVALGCGAETYQARLVGNTVPFFRYQADLTASLGPRWQTGEVSLRPPVGFSEIRGPKKDETVDRRIPPALGRETLTGLLGAFRGTVEAASSSGGTVKAPSQILVLSNRSLLAAKQPAIKPSEFDRWVLNRISGALGRGHVATTSLKPVEVGTSGVNTHQGFAPVIRYDHFAVEAAGDVPMRYEIYIYRHNPQNIPPEERLPPEKRLHVAVVFIVPKEAARSERLTDKIEMSLQTLKIEQGGSAGTGAARSGGGGPAF